MTPIRPRRRGAKKTMGKRQLAKAKRIIGNKKVSKAKSNQDTHFLRCKTNVYLTPVQGTTVTNYIYAAFQLYTTGTVPTWDVRNNTDFKLYSKMYDRFRINRMNIRVTPKANVLDMANAQADGYLSLSGTNTIHTAIDRDGSVPVSIDAFRKYSSYKQYSLLKPFSRSYSVRWPRSVWLDCDEFLSSDTQITRTIGCSGGITLYAENVLEEIGEGLNEPWAQVEITYDVVFEGKTMRSVTIDNSGNVVLSAFVDKEDPNAVGLVTLVTDGR